jgi:hypothetical protein
MSYSSHLPFRFPLEEKKSCLQTLRRFYGVTSFSRYLLVEIIFYENQVGPFASYEALDFES